MSNKDQVFLGKAGKVYGPYAHEEFERMYASGKLTEFTWIWDAKNQAWKTIEVPPPAPPTSAGSGPSKTKSSMNWNEIQALCFDQSSLISGKLDGVTESGCILISEHKEGGTKFSIRSQVELNIFDSSSEKSTTVGVSIADISYSNSSWIYRLRWKEVPNFKGI